MLEDKIKSLSKKWKKKLSNAIPKHVLVSIFMLIICSVIVVGYSLLRWEKYDIDGILVEAHGMLFDILVLGVIVLWLDIKIDKKNEQKNNIKRWKEEIDDFRGWNDREATFRIIGNLKRLSKNKENFINLSNCYLNEVDFSEEYFPDMDFRNAIFVKAYLSRSILNRDFSGANFTNAYLQFAEFKEAILREVNFTNANLSLVDFSGRKDISTATFIGADLERAKLIEVDLSNKNLTGTSIIRADLTKAKLRNVDLSKKDLNGTILIEADLTGTDLTDLDLSEKGLCKTIFTSATCTRLNLYKANLSQSEMRDIIDWEHISNIRYANLYGIIDPPKGFLNWARKNGAVEIESIDEYEHYLNLLEGLPRMRQIMSTLQTQCDVLFEKLKMLQEQYILETRPEEKLRLNPLIQGTKKEINRVEKQSIKIDSEIKTAQDLLMKYTSSNSIAIEAEQPKAGDYAKRDYKSKLEMAVYNRHSAPPLPRVDIEGDIAFAEDFEEYTMVGSEVQNPLGE